MKEICFKGRFCSKAGFTLIELLVVVLIIGILAAVALPQYNRAIEKTRMTEALHHIDVMKKAIDVYLLEHGFPTEQTDMLGTGVLDIEISFLSETSLSAKPELWMPGVDGDSVLHCSSDFCYFAVCDSEYCAVKAGRLPDSKYIIVGYKNAGEPWGSGSFYGCSDVGQYLYKTLQPLGYTEMEC